MERKNNMDDVIRQPTTSPVVIDAEIVREVMDFPEAIRGITIGLRMTKEEWKNEEIYGILKDGKLMIHKEDGLHQWIVSEGDMVGEDWYEVKEVK